MKLPPVLVDLYWDLWDRRLLPLIALVVVAIVAVPFLLSGGSEEPSGPRAGAGPVRPPAAAAPAPPHPPRDQRGERIAPVDAAPDDVDRGQQQQAPRALAPAPRRQPPSPSCPGTCSAAEAAWRRTTNSTPHVWGSELRARAS